MPDPSSQTLEGAAPDPPDTLLGRTLAGKYKLEKKLGEGGMGAVYKARQLALEKTIAVKVMHAQLATDAMFAGRFHREAKAASRLDHPNSIGILDYGQEPDGLLYIAMEFLDGKDLLALLDAEAPLPAGRIVDILSQALSALAVAHDMGIIHRDLKPENIMILRKKGEDDRVHDVVKVCDFGIAKVAESEEVDDTVPANAKKNSKLTTAGLVIGTPEYMSPEQGRGEPLDARCDLYSMGVILYLLLSGQTPFDAPTPLGIVLKHQSEDPLPPSRIRAMADLRLEAVCLKAMSKRPADRYATAREMRSALRAVVDATLSEASVVIRTQLSQDSHARTELLVTPPTQLAAQGFGQGVTEAMPAQTGPVPGLPAGDSLQASEAARATSAALTTGTGPVPAPSSRLGLKLGGLVLALAVLGGGGFYGRTLLLHAESEPPAKGEAKPASAPPPAHGPTTPEPPAPPPPAAPVAPHVELVQAPLQSPSALNKRDKPTAVGDVRGKQLGEAVMVTPSPPPPPEPPPPEAPAPPPPPQAAPQPHAMPAEPAPAPPPFDPSHVRVVAGPASVMGGGVNERAVNKVVGSAMGKITSCYRGSATASSPEGSWNLHLATDDSGNLVESRLDGPLPDQVKSCIAQTMMRSTVPADTGAVNATVVLTFNLR